MNNVQNKSKPYTAPYTLHLDEPISEEEQPAEHWNPWTSRLLWDPQQLSKPQKRDEVCTVEERVQDLIKKVKIVHGSDARAKILKSEVRGRSFRLQQLYKKTLFSPDERAPNLEDEGKTLDREGMLKIMGEIIQYGNDAHGAIDKQIFRVVCELLKTNAIYKEGLEALDSEAMETIKEKLINW